MIRTFSSIISDRIWPSLDGDVAQHERAENEKLCNEIDCIKEAAANLRPTEEQLKEYLKASENLLEDERSRKAGIESRLLNAAGLVSIAGTVVLGALFSLASEKLSLNSTWAREVLSIGCLYLAIQLVAALRAAVLGLKATGYAEDLPHELLPKNSAKHSVFLRRRVQQVLVRVAEHRLVNNRKLDQLNVAHHAMENFLWGLLAVAVVAFFVSLMWSPPIQVLCPEGAQCQLIHPQPLPVPAPRLQAESNSVGLLGVGLPAILVIGGACTATLGIALLTMGGTTTRRVMGIAMTVGGFGLGIIGSSKLEATIFKVDKLIGELRLELSLGAKDHTQQTLLRRIVTVGPFPDGDHLLPEEQVAKCVKLAVGQYKGIPIGGWEVVGRVDKRPLRPDRAAIYGSNQALAMSRANWVAQKILPSQPPFESMHTVISVGGARGVGTRLGTNDLQSDRAVDVFAVVNVLVDDNRLPALPKPVVCPLANTSQ